MAVKIFSARPSDSSINAVGFLLFASLSKLLSIVVVDCE